MDGRQRRGPAERLAVVSRQLQQTADAGTSKPQRQQQQQITMQRTSEAEAIRWASPLSSLSTWHTF